MAIFASAQLSNILAYATDRAAMSLNSGVCPTENISPDGTAQKPANPRKWSILNSSNKSCALLRRRTHQEYPLFSMAFQSYRGLEVNMKLINKQGVNRSK